MANLLTASFVVHVPSSSHFQRSHNTASKLVIFLVSVYSVLLTALIKFEVCTDSVIAFLHLSKIQQSLPSNMLFGVVR